MLKSTVKNMRLHYHAGRIGFHFDGIKTYYLSQKQAKDLSEALKQCLTKTELYGKFTSFFIDSTQKEED